MCAAIEAIGEGWKAVHVDSEEECLSTLETRTFSTLVIDHSPPQIDAMPILREIRGRGWAVPVILVTALGNEQLISEALGLKLSEYVPKDRENLAARLSQAVVRSTASYSKKLQAISAMSRMRVQMARRTHQNLLDGFVAPIIHDIRNPIFYILGMADQLLTQPEDQETLRHGLTKIIQKAEWINELVERLLLFARQDAEERVRMDLTAWLSTLLTREAGAMHLHNVRLISDLPPDPTWIRAAPRAIEQVFQNLLANAVEALVQGRAGGVITVRLRLETSRAEVIVEDNGPGIPPEILPQLFRPFATSAKKKKGTGLGLSIVAGIVREHGGRVQAESELGHGSRFTLWIPLEHERPVALVLEDDESMQKLIQSQLESLGLRTEIYGDGAQVLSKLDQGHWNLVILDMRASQVGGLAVFEEILRSRPDLVDRTMIVSGCIEDRGLQDLMEKTPVPCLSKPYSIRDLHDVVRFLLRSTDGEQH